jgi:hypothetical protein
LPGWASRGRAGEPYFFFDPDELAALAAQHRAAYAAAEPFPHAVLDGLIPDAVARRLLAEFPAAESFQRMEVKGEPLRRGKLSSFDETAFGGFTRQLLHHLNSWIFVAFLEQLTGIAGLLPDPDVGHSMRHFEPGGKLGIHADFNTHPRLRLDRRLNLLVYLNLDWRPEWGGQLELWDADVARCVRRIEPAFGRSVVFTTTDRTFHGFPDPLRCPPRTTRKSIQLYYYTNGRPESEVAPPHPTLWRHRPGESLDAGEPDSPQPDRG